MPDFFVIDGSLSLEPGWKDYVKAPEAPANYKKPEVIEAYIQGKLETLEYEVFQSCPSLMTASNIKLAWTCELAIPSFQTIEDIILAAHDRVYDPTMRMTIIGDKNLLLAHVAHPSPSDSIAMRDLRYRLWSGKLSMMTLEEFRFTTCERKMLLTDKILQRPEGMSYMDFVKKSLDEWGLARSDEWSTYFNGTLQAPDF